MGSKNTQRIYELLDKAFKARCREQEICNQVTQMLQEHASFKIKDCFWQPSDGYVISFAAFGNLPVCDFLEIVKSKGGGIVTKDDIPNEEDWSFEDAEFN